jgi:two-component system OmpR family sensor kinase
MTIRTRLTLWYSSLLATLILVFGISLFSILNWAWRSQVRDNMLYIAQQTAENIRVDPASGHLIANLPENLDLIPYYLYGIQVWERDHHLAGASSYLSHYSRAFDEDMLFNSKEVTRDVYLGSSRQHALVLTTPILAADGQLIGSMQIVSLLTTIDAATDRLFKVMLGVGIVALVLSFMVGSVIAGQALQPIDNISQTAKQITDAGDLSKRIPYDGPPDELGQLTATFNATLGRLERLFLMQRRFVADVSHELRTPLTTIQGNLDLIKRFGNDPVSLEAMDSEVKRMTRLVGDLLLLAQADSGRQLLVETRIELASLVLEVFKQAQVLAEEVELRLGQIEPVNVQGDPDRLKQLILNLLTNAIKYTPPGGEVTLEVTQQDGYAFIRVKDTGIGIPKEDIEHIFDRFYRVDKARSRQLGGTGLGLSIARWIAEAHRGKIWAESEVGKGSTFIVQLPSLDAITPPDATRDTRPRIPVLLRRPRIGQSNAAKRTTNAASTPFSDAATTRSDTYEQKLAPSTPSDPAARSPGSEHDGDPSLAR